jgi:hypothetical protein
MPSQLFLYCHTKFTVSKTKYKTKFKQPAASERLAAPHDDTNFQEIVQRTLVCRHHLQTRLLCGDDVLTDRASGELRRDDGELPAARRLPPPPK